MLSQYASFFPNWWSFLYLHCSGVTSLCYPCCCQRLRRNRKRRSSFFLISVRRVVEAGEVGHIRWDVRTRTQARSFAFWIPKNSVNPCSVITRNCSDWAVSEIDTIESRQRGETRERRYVSYPTWKANLPASQPAHWQINISASR